jgi:hypothetical protein
MGELCMIGSAVTKINIEWIDFVVLIPDKSELNVKWYVWIYLCKSGFNNKFNAKINCKSQKLQIVASSRINSTSKINSSLNHPNMLKSLLQPLESLLSL